MGLMLTTTLGGLAQTKGWLLEIPRVNKQKRNAKNKRRLSGRLNRLRQRFSTLLKKITLFD